MRITILLGSLLFAGCAGNLYMDISREDFQDLQLADTVDIVYQGTPFWLQTTGTVVSGGLLPDAINKKTGASEIPSGAEIVRTYQVTPPIEDIKDYLVDNFNVELELSIGSFSPVSVPYDKELDLVVEQKSSGSGYTLKLKNTQWFSSYTTFDWNTQMFAISAAAELIRKKDDTVVWKGHCNANGNDDPTMKMETRALVADEARQLKGIVKHGAEVCAQELLAQIKQVSNG